MMLSDFIAEDLTQIYYFAYGMLTDPETIGDRAEFIGKARLDNFSLELLLHANIVPSRTHMYGALWLINQDMLDELDEVEGYPTYYRRISRSVVANGSQYNAQIYIMTNDSRRQYYSSSPSQSYINQIAQGYRHAGIPVSQLNTAIVRCNTKQAR